MRALQKHALTSKPWLDKSLYLLWQNFECLNFWFDPISTTIVCGLANRNEIHQPNTVRQSNRPLYYGMHYWQHQHDEEEL